MNISALLINSALNYKILSASEELNFVFIYLAIICPKQEFSKLSLNQVC